MRVGAKTDPGRVRASNEDRYGVLPNLLVVADGMGGVQAGEVASQLAVDALLVHPFGASDPAELVAAIKAANRNIHQAASGRPEWQGMGTTITAALLSGSACHIAQVGDSRAYLLRDGEIQRLTKDHSLVEELLRNGSISVEEALLHPQRNLLTRALGTSEDVEVDVTTVALSLDDVLVLCTDGLTGVVADGEILEEVMRHADPQRAAEGLVALANDRGGPDNITVVVAHLLPPVLQLEADAELEHRLDDTVALESVCVR